MEVKLSAGEKLILLMLREIQEHLKMKADTDTKLIKDAIFSGNLWGLGLPAFGGLSRLRNASRGRGGNSKHSNYVGATGAVVQQSSP